jgi:hypothetical protein
MQVLHRKDAMPEAGSNQSTSSSGSSGSPGMGFGIGVACLSNSGKMSGRLLGWGVIHSCTSDGTDDSQPSNLDMQDAQLDGVDMQDTAAARCFHVATRAVGSLTCG